MTKSKKLLSLFLAVLMAFSSLTVGLYAFAADEETDKEEVSAVAEIEALCNTFYDNKYQTAMFSTKEADAEKKEAALQAFDELCSKIKALSDTEKLELKTGCYTFVMALAADKAGRDAGQSSTAAKVYGSTEGFAQVTEMLGALPAEYQAGYDTAKEIYISINDKSFGSSFDFKANEEGYAHYEAVIDKVKELSPAAVQFANYLYPNAPAFYVYSAKPTIENKYFVSNILGLVKNYYQDKMSETGKDPSSPSYSKFIKRSGDNYSWLDGQNAVTYKEAHDNYYNAYLTDTVAPGKEAFSKQVELFSAIYGEEIADAALTAFDTGIKYYETGEITVPEINTVLEKINAVTGTPAEVLKSILDSAKVSIKMTYGDIEYNETASAKDVYENQIKTETVTVNNIVSKMKDVLTQIQLDEFNEAVAKADLDNLDEATVENIRAKYAVLGSTFQKKVDSETYAKFVKIVTPFKNKDDLSQAVADFKTIPVNRADIGGDIIWTKEGVQNSVDGTYDLVKTVLGFLNLEINGNKVDLTNGLNDLLKDNVYQASVVNAIFDLYAELSHNDTAVQGDITIGVVITMLISTSGIKDLLAQKDNRFAGAIAKINEITVTKEDEEAGINGLDKLAAIEFTDADFGFKNGDKDGFIDAVLAAIRPITKLLLDGNFVLSIAKINLNLFDSVDGNGVYNKGIYSLLLPLLEQIGLTDLFTTEDYKANIETVRAADKNLGYDEVLRPIVNSLFKNVIQPIADRPLDGVIAVLPRLAYVINTNMVTDTVKAVIASTGNTLAGLASGIDLSAKAINNMIEGVVIQVNEDTEIRLKAINWHILSDCATVKAVPSHTLSNAYVLLRTGDVDSCFSTVYFYIYELLFANKNTYNAVKALLGSAVDKTLLSIITSITDNLAGVGRNQSFGQFLKLTGYEGDTAIPRTKADAQKRFTDLAGAEYYDDYVAYTSVYNSFITGTNPPQRTLFSPNATITRAMFITILYRMDGEPYKNANPHDKTPFTDIKDTSVYYYDAACWALDQGISNQTTFRAYDNVSRQETAAFLFRYAQLNDLILNENYKNVDLSVFNDSETIRDWAQECMQWANYNGMITGTQQGNANPDGATFRIHATKILYGFGKNCDIGNFA